MIALLAGLALGAPHSSAGGLVGVASVRTGARHAVMPALGGWALYRKGFAVGTEVFTLARNTDGELYTHRRREVSAAALVGGGLDSGAFGVDWLVGPVGALAWGRLTADGIDRPFTEPTIGMKLRNGIDLRPSEHVVVRLGMGATTRGLQRWDYDVVFGIGGAW